MVQDFVRSPSTQLSIRIVGATIAGQAGSVVWKQRICIDPCPKKGARLIIQPVKVSLGE